MTQTVRSNLVDSVGAWSALATAVLTTAFVVASIAFSPTEWHSLDSYVAGYSQREVLIWIPCFLFALTYLMTAAAIGNIAPGGKRLFYHVALAFGVIYSAVVSLNAYLQLTVLRLNVLSGTTAGLDILALPNPHSVTWALEGLGYAFLGLSTLFLSFTLGHTRMELAVRILYVVNSALGIAGLVIGPVDFPALMLPGIGIWSIEYPAVNILLFLFFRSRLRSI
jgi:hypothetical protein